jgi:hypothetical protein
MVVVGVTGAVILPRSYAPPTAVASGRSGTVAAPAPVAVFAGQSVIRHPGSDGTVPWEQPLTVSVTHGTIRSVVATGPQGAVTGTLTAAGWTGSSTLVPSSR